MLGRLLWKPLPQLGPLHRVTPIKKGAGEGGGQKSARKPGERQLRVYRSKRGDERHTARREVETSRGLGLALLNINSDQVAIFERAASGDEIDSLVTQLSFAAASWLHAKFLTGMGPTESDHDSIPAEVKETERDKSRFTVKLVVLVNAFLFTTCFFMDNSVFPVSILNRSICYASINTAKAEEERQTSDFSLQSAVLSLQL